ncbi:MAG: DinB family protein [Flavobacteriales bacterium]|nr:DinB family protein [Flavobacteriales bacterium]MCB9168589.1 DinB family protein [Flavobacteriales bacterium]
MTTPPGPHPSIGRPGDVEVPAYYREYVRDADGGDLVRALHKASDDVWSTVYHIAPGAADMRYAPDKWSIKEIFQHLIDAERIFCYRALRFSRNDDTALEGFDENTYVPEAKVERRGLHQLLREHDAVRASTIELFRSFDDDMLRRMGTANGERISVRALGWVIAGHAMHHMRVVRERYLHR